MSNQLFVNPYNFIPFGSEIGKQRKSREKVYCGQERLVSGWLTVDLDTKTPLIIPDGAHPKYWDIDKKQYVKDPDEKKKKVLHKEYSFLKVPGESGEEPVIPGSELRGMIRSAYEAVTDSCTAFLLDDKPISQRVPVYGALRKRGLLAYEETITGSGERRWVLYSTYAETEAVQVKDTTLKYKDGRKVTEKNGDFIPGHGWLQYNIPVNKDDEYHIAYLSENEKIYIWEFLNEDGTPDTECNDEPYRALKSALKDRPKNLKNRNEVPNKNLQNALERAKAGKDNKVPVYYFIVKRGDEKLVYLSNSSIGRIAQRRKWKEIMGDHAPCSDTDHLCPACLLFGTTEGKGMKGHIRVTDAAPAGNFSKEFHTLQILGAPRTSAFEFYLRKPEEKRATYWNFDFYGEKVTDSNGNDHTEYHDLEQAAPRGRKMYWHSPIASDAPKSRMNSTMEALNGSFRFKIYFDEITETQLQDLIWVITLGENKKDSKLQHKLGHAKPLGYGSVKLTVSEKAIRNIMINGDSVEVHLEKTKFGDINTKPGEDLDQTAAETLKIMCNAEAVPEGVPIIYPKKQDIIYKWFANNRKNADSVRTLPEPSDKRLTLSGSWSQRTPAVADISKKSYKSQTNKNVPRMKGKIKFYNEEQNFGYIAVEGHDDYRINIGRYNPDIRAEDLKKGCTVTFVPKVINNKKVANDCRLVE